MAARPSTESSGGAPYGAPIDAEALVPRQPKRPWRRRLGRSWRDDLEHAEYVEFVKRLERAVLGSSDGLWEWELDTGRVWIMPQLAALLGQTMEELPKHIDQWWGEFHPDDLAGVQEAIFRHIDFGDPYERQFRLRIQDGSYRWFRARGLAYRDGAGKALVVAGSICDIDDLIRTQQALYEKDSQLVQQQKVDAIGSLAGGVAHEFNNLLQGIRGYAAFARQAASTPQQATDLQHVLDMCDRAAKFTRQLLDFSRKGATQPARCTCADLLAGLESLIKLLLPPGVRLTIQQDARDLAVHANERLLQQALLNLCINACDAMPDGGQLLVRCESYAASPWNAEVNPCCPPGSYVRILVTDTGVGIAPEAAEHLFEPFFTTKEEGRGTGLGLSTAQSIVSQSGGSMDFFSTPGHGATFRIYLPVCETAPADGKESTELNDAKLDAMILLAEDDEAIRDVGRRMLERAGCRVITASTGAEVTALFHKRIFEIDAVVLDLALPDMSGRDVVEEIRETAPEIPVCLCTGYDPAAPQFDGLRAMGCGIVEKPFDERRLTSAVRMAMNAAHDPLVSDW